MKIIIKKILMKAYNFIEIVKRYYVLLRRIY